MAVVLLPRGLLAGVRRGICPVLPRIADELALRVIEAAAFETATTVSAGNPCFYLFGSGTDIEDPKFENVVIEDVWGGAIQEQYGELIGSYDLGDISDANKGMALVVDDGQLDFSEMTTGFGNFFVIPQERADGGLLAINTLRLEFGSTIIEKRIAEDWKGEGTEKSPYLVSNSYDLNLMVSSFNGPEAAKFSGKYFLQTADVEFDKTVENNYTAVRSFTGHYDGAGYTIGGLKKGKTYYISIRVRKKVDGINYYTTFGVPKKIKITQ